MADHKTFTRSKITCPKCQQKLVLKRTPKPGETSHCPACQQKITLVPAPSSITVKPEPIRPPAAPGIKTSSNLPNVAAKPTSIMVRLQRNRMRTVVIATTLSLLGCLVALWLIFYLVNHVTLSPSSLPIAIVIGLTASAIYLARRIDWASYPRLTRRLLVLSIATTPPLASLIFIIYLSFSSLPNATTAPASLLASAVLWLWLPLGSLVAHLLSPLIMGGIFNAIRCPDCHEPISVIQAWSCGCGYVSHKPRNLFLRRCPSCRARSGHTACPRCQATILL